MRAIAATGAVVIRVLGHSWRIQTLAGEHLDAARSGGKPVLFVFWHGRLLPLSFTHRARQIHVLASQHADGEMLGQTIRRLGFGHVRGSSTRGGARAIMELVEKVRAGYDLGLTVDGPRGPRHIVKPGVAEIAKVTGSPILPITTASHRHRTFSSWDAFQLPHLFSRVVVRYGAPIYVAPDADRDALEAARFQTESALRDITAEADRDVA
jgi:lysophospholipid acyltransferase (LPLAT)-like uncharacterized protein